VAKDDLRHTLKEGDPANIRGRVVEVIALGQGTLSARAFIDLTPHRGQGTRSVLVAIELG
jgi:hypothetical protein